MTDQTYALAKSGVFGLSAGVYQDSLLTIVDDWEDNDYAEWSNVQNVSSKTAITGSKVGSYAGEMTATSNGLALVRSDTVSGIDTFDRYSGWVQAANNADSDWVALGYNYQDASNYYYVEINIPNNNFRLRKVSGGSYSTLASASQSVSKASWYKFKGSKASDDTHSWDLLDSTESTLATISATDATHGAGDVTVSVRASGTIRTDQVEVVE